MGRNVFGQFTQQELDAQYNNQSACPDFARVLETYAQRSRHAAPLAGERDVPWGSAVGECLDIYRPAGSEPVPVVVFVHGGGWLILNKESSAFAAPAFVAGGYMFVALGFRTAAVLDFATMVERVREGVGWIVRNIHRHGGDARRIVLVGHSSGTHLVTQCLTHDWSGQGLDGAPFAGALLVSGLGDLEPVRLSYRNHRLNLSVADVARYSLLAGEVTVPCPVSIVTAQADTPEFQRQSAAMAQYFRARGTLREHYVVPDRNHFDVILDLAEPHAALFHTVGQLVGESGRR